MGGPRRRTVDRMSPLVGLALVLTLAGLASSPGPGAADAARLPAVAGFGTAPRHDPHLGVAQALAADTLAASSVPPGSVAAGAAPEGATLLRDAPSRPGTPELVDVAAWWTTPGTPAGVLAWFRDDPPDSGAFVSSGAYSGPDQPTEQYLGFSLPVEVPGVVSSRQVFVAVVPDGEGTVAVRIDAQVVWVPTRTAASEVPREARVVTVQELAGADATQEFPAITRTVRAPSAVAHLVALVNSLPPANDGVTGCVAFPGRSFRLTFSAGPPKDQVLATLGEEEAWCFGMALTVRGRQQPGLMDPGNHLLSAIESMLDVSPSPMAT